MANVNVFSLFIDSGIDTLPQEPYTEPINTTLPLCKEKTQ
jgi:hypothetical protein